MTALILHAVSKTFEGVKAADDISFSVKEGAINALIGPNGAGKTTLFDIITGFVSPDAGDIYFRDRRITHLSAPRIVRLGIGRTFQDIRLFPNLSVADNVLVAMQRGHTEGLFASLFLRTAIAKEETKNEEIARGHLKTVGLLDKREALASELSQGQRRLLEIARILALDPEIVLMDEPTAGVFPQMIEHMKSLLRELRARGKTILLIEHNMNVVMDIADHVFVLNYGRKIAEGPPKSIQSDPEVITAYLGRRRG